MRSATAAMRGYGQNLRPPHGLSRIISRMAFLWSMEHVVHGAWSMGHVVHGDAGDGRKYAACTAHGRSSREIEIDI